MCVLCGEGKTIDDWLEGVHDAIARRGFAVVPVEAGEGSWGYTIGLLDGVGHPELVVVDPDVGHAGGVLVEAGARVLAGERISPESPVEMCGGRLEVVTVHPFHVDRGLLNGWLQYYDAAGRWDLEPEAVQVLVPDGRYCDCHQPDRRLDSHRTPWGLNRACRRAARSGRPQARRGPVRRQRRRRSR